MLRTMLPTRPLRHGLLTALGCALLALAQLAPAQVVPTDATRQATADTEPSETRDATAATAPAPGSPEAVADAAVRAWLQRAPIAIDQLTRLDAEALCRELPGLVTSPPPPAGTEVRFDDRVERPVDDPNTLVFTYAAVRPGDQLDVVEVRLQRQGDGWVDTRVGFLSLTEPRGVRAWLQTPMASWLFVGFTLIVVLMLLNPASGLRRWLAQARAAIAEHRRLVIGTVVALFGLFGLGVLAGSALPESCDVAVLEIVESAISSLGATAAYGSGDVPRAAATTFYQNFVVVTLSLTFTLSAILGVPGYLYAAVSFFVQGVPFGLIGGGTAVELVGVVLLVLVELSAYFIVVAGGGMLLATVVKGGFGTFRLGFTKLLLMLPVAMVLLLAGAWYEALIVILGF